ncbi:MAG: hypothetical protein SV375_11955 [Thermodesulfobacteriota bacterium]|nr:hypothetical protein [Thermodesulfobacteriota bacterium]
MEDQKRGVESYRKKIPSVKKKYPHDAESTVMIMRSIGKVRSFKISRRLVFNAFLFLFIYIVVSLLIINDYFIIDKDLHLRRISSLQSEKIRELEREVSKKKKDIHKFKQHIALLNDLITNFQNGLEDDKKPHEMENLREEGSIQDIEPTKGPVDQKKRLAHVVEIKNLKIQKASSRMTVKFKLVNMQSEGGPIAGYLHIIAMSKDANSPPEWIYPKEKLQKNLPLNYRRGLPFLIHRFKPYRRKFNLDSNSELPTAIKVLVYNQAGIIILEKEIEVSSVS